MSWLAAWLAEFGPKSRTPETNMTFEALMKSHFSQNPKLKRSQQEDLFLTKLTKQGAETHIPPREELLTTTHKGQGKTIYIHTW